MTGAVVVTQGAGWHVGKIGTGAATVGVVAMIDGAITAALIAGVFTLVNTCLTVWLTGQQRSKRKRKDDDE